MKKVFLTVGEDIIARNILQTAFWSRFLDLNKENKITLLVHKDKQAHFTELFSADNVVVEGYEHAPFSKMERMLFSLARSAIKSNTNLWSKMRSYERGHTSLLMTYVKRLHTFLFGSSNIYKKLLRALILRTKPDQATKELFDRHCPDTVVCLSLTNFEFDVPVAKEAKRRGIKIVGMVRSWDNFSSHGLLRVEPDVLLLQNQFLKDMAAEHQVITEKRIPITIVGVPHYDVYKNPESLLVSREEFFKMYDLDPTKKLIVYGAMGDFLFPHEAELVDVFEEVIEDGLINEPSQVFFRIHPKFPNALEHIKGKKHVSAHVNTAYVDQKGGEAKLDSTSILINTLVHADVVTTGASTIAIDATVLKKPVICVGFDGLTSERDAGYWPSVRRFYDTYTHFEALMGTGAIKLAQDKKELAMQINECFKAPKVDMIRQQRVLGLFVEPFDGQAGQRVAEAISREV